MTLNSWSFTGTVIKFDARQGGGGAAPWGKMWILVGLDPVKKPDDTLIDNNTVFLNINLVYDTSDKKYKSTKKLLDAIKAEGFISVREARIDNIKRSKKNDSGSWEDYTEIGIRANPDQISCSSVRLPGYNYGSVAGKVLDQKGNTVIVEERYMVPGKTVEWKSRSIPLVLDSQYKTESLKNKYIVATAKLSGTGPSGNQAVCGYTSGTVMIT